MEPQHEKHRLFCPMCQQKLAVDTRDLRGSVRCPRCRSSFSLQELVSPRTTIEAVSADDFPLPEEHRGPPQKKLFCPQCAQRLSVDASDLSERIRCPRCTNVFLLEELISPRETLEAVSEYEVEADAPLEEHQATASAQPPALIVTTPDAQQTEYRGTPLVPAPPEAMPDQREDITDDVPTAPSTSDRIRAAAATAAKTATTIGRILNAFRKASIWLDTMAHGKRQVLLVILLASSAFCKVGAVFSAQTYWPTLESVFFWTTVILAAVFLLARMTTSEDESGRWKGWDLIKDFFWSLRDFFVFLYSFLRAWIRPGTNPFRERMETTADFLALISAPLYLILRFTESGFVLLAAMLLLIAIVLTSIAWLVGKIVPRHTVSASQARSLAPVLDCVRNRKNAIKLARASGNKDLVSLVDALCDWRPRGKNLLEADYQRRLVRHLKHSIEMDVSSEHPYTANGEYCRFDILLGGSVVLELKRDLARSSESDRAAGQVRRYTRLWGDRGPVILLVCESTRDFTSTGTVRELAELNNQGKPVFVVAAGKAVA